MSAYGEIQCARPGTPLKSTAWPYPLDSGKDGFISVYHLTLMTARSLPGLLDYLGDVFAKVVEEGQTYPQEDMTSGKFEAYFFAADVFIGIIGTSTSREAKISDIQIERGKRTWEECIAGYYYIKPNYPGRSSHICNAGFVVPPTHRGKGHGSLLAQSYVHYAPLLGYQASVFNLVYVNNIASVRLWEKLGFIKAGRIPRAGRLRKNNGLDEEYIDAWIFYKDFTLD